MATCTWYGTAPTVAQVDNFIPANVEIGDVFTLTNNGKTVSFTATAATVANVTAGLTAAWNASTYNEMAELTAADATTRMTLTADTPGRPFTVTSSATDGGGTNTQTLTRGSSTSNSSPNDWSIAANWSGGAVPVNSDTVVIDGLTSNSSILYGLDQSAVTLAGISIINGYSGLIGLPEFVSSTYREWRETDLTIACTSLSVDSTSGRLKIDVLTSSAAIIVNATGSPETTGVPAMLFACGSGPTSVTVTGGSVGIGQRSGQTAVVPILNVTAGDVYCGTGATLTTIKKFGGSLYVQSNTTSLVQQGGITYLRGTSAHTAITNSKDAVVSYESSGTCTAYTGNDTSLITFDGRYVARTLTNGTFNDAARLTDTNRTVTHSNGLAFVGEVASRLKCGRTYTVTPT